MTASYPPKSCLGVQGYALVTGGGSGIGRATSLLLAREYCAGIALADINQGGIDKVKAELESVATNPDFKCITIVVNVADEDSVRNMVSKAVEAFGRIDYAANIAGIGAVKGPIAESKMEDWNKMIAVNLTGVFICAKECIMQMMKQEPRKSDKYGSTLPNIKNWEEQADFSTVHMLHYSVDLLLILLPWQVLQVYIIQGRTLPQNMVW